MKYTSTRDASISCTFEKAICSGYAPDGGLFVPTNLPKINTQTLQSWSSLSYPKLACQVLRLFISTNEILDDELAQICYDSFVKGFGETKTMNTDGTDDADDNDTNDANGTNTDTIPLKKIGSSYMVELFHGPTFCFKDLG